MGSVRVFRCKAAEMQTRQQEELPALSLSLLFALSFSPLSVSIFAVSPLRLCLRSHLDWQCYKINTLRAGRVEEGARGVPEMRGWLDPLLLPLDWISAHCQQQLLWDLATWMAVNVTG